MKNSGRRSPCPISSTLEVLGDRWTLLIIRDLMFNGKKTYGEFLLSPERIATNILADRLSFLEEKGLIEKRAFPGNKAKSLYRLTDKGADLLPVILEIIVWGEKHFETPEKIRIFARQIRANRAGVIKKIAKRLAEEQTPMEEDSDR